MILAKYKYSVNTFLVLCYLMQNIVDNAIRLMYSIGRDRALNTKTEGRNNLMKKRISLALTVLLVLSVCVLPFATHAAEDVACDHSIDVGKPKKTFSTKWDSIDASKHKKIVEEGWTCDCGRYKLSHTVESNENHQLSTYTTPHNNGQHTTTKRCTKCTYKYTNTYDCPGGKYCLYPESIRELY